MMKTSVLSTVIGLLTTSLFAITAATDSQVLVTFPKTTPESIVEDAMNKVKDAGGIISHEFTLIKGFVASTEAEILDEIRTLSTEFPAKIEEDTKMSTQDDA